MADAKPQNRLVQGNVPAKAPKKVNSGSFVPGRSGNPGGRPKALGDLQELARGHTTQAIEALVRGLSDPKFYPTCAGILLDRGWGKAAQPISGDDGGPLQIIVRRMIDIA